MSEYHAATLNYKQARGRLKAAVQARGFFRQPTFHRASSSSSSSRPPTSSSDGSSASSGRRRDGETVELLKARTLCSSCGQRGHWRKDPQCPNNAHKVKMAETHEPPVHETFIASAPLSVDDGRAHALPSVEAGRARRLDSFFLPSAAHMAQRRDLQETNREYSYDYSQPPLSSTIETPTTHQISYEDAYQTFHNSVPELASHMILDIVRQRTVAGPSTWLRSRARRNLDRSHRLQGAFQIRFRCAHPIFTARLIPTKLYGHRSLIPV